MSNHGIGAYNAVFAQDYTGKYASSIADEGIRSNVDWSFAKEWLLDKKTHVGIHLVGVIADIHMFAEQATIFDGDVRYGCHTRKTTNGDITSDDDAGLVLIFAVGREGSKPAIFPNRASVAYLNELSALNETWTLNKGITS